MPPKKDVVYSKGRGRESMSVDPSCRIIKEDYDNEKDATYVPPGSSTPTVATRVTKGTPER